MTTQELTLKYTLEGDFEDQYRDYLSGLLLVTGGITSLVVGVQVTYSPNAQLLPWLLIAAMSGISFFMIRHKHVTLALWTYLIGLSGALNLQIAFNEIQASTYLIMLLPLMLSTLLLDTKSMIRFSVGTVGSIALITLTRVPISTLLQLLGLPTLLGLTLIVIAYINKQNIMELVHWATDSQQKDANRAEIFYQQREELKDLLLQLQHANAQLEIMNIKLDEAQRKTEQVSKAKSIFLSNMSHELRTPLNVVIGYASSMLDMPQIYEHIPLPKTYRSDVQLIKENGQYLVGLINDILDLSKIEAGHLKLRCAPVNVADLCKGVISTSLGLLKGKPVQIRPDFTADLPKVWADSLRVRQITLNLMSNAIKFTETGSVTLAARVEGDFLRISVTDTGIGIPENALQTIFDRFQQASQDTERHYGGTGLGLDISKQLSVMHGGDLSVQSKVGKGSTFSFTLPLATPEQLGDAFSEEVIDHNIELFEPGLVNEIHTVLLVEDDVNTRVMLRRTLESQNYVVVDTHDGAQAIELVGSLLPSLVILDINLPHKDGWEILQAIKANEETAAIPVIICTVDEADGRSDDMGAALHIRKPLNPEDLLIDVEKILA